MSIKISIGKKIGFVFFIFFLGLAGISAVFFINDQLRNTQIEELEEEMEELHLVHELRISLAQYVMPVNDFLIIGADPKEPENFQKLSRRVELLIASLDQQHFDDSDEDLLFSQIKKNFQQSQKIARQIFSMPNAAGNPQAGHLMEEMDSIVDEAVVLGKEFQDEAYEELKALKENIENEKKRFDRISQIGIASTVVMLIFSFFFFRHTITNPITELQKAAKEIGMGNLNYYVTIRTRDEIEDLGKAFNDMSKSLLDSEQKLIKREQMVRSALENLEKTHNDLKQTQQQLIQSEKLASIGQLAAGVAHEINNPIGFIGSNLQTLKEYINRYEDIFLIVEEIKKSIQNEKTNTSRELTEKLYQTEEDINFVFMKKDMYALLEESQRGIDRVKKIVFDLRVFSREDKDKKEYKRVEDIIDGILNIVNNEIKYKAELKKEYAQTSSVCCYPQKLGQVFMNLLINASQAMEDKGKISIKTYEEKQYVYIEISDTGKGIPLEQLNKIFDPFFTTKPVGKGTGLGLSISYEIVKRHGGEMKVQSEVGKGTTFTVMLPVLDDHAGTEA